MRNKSEIRRKIRALKDMSQSKDATDTISKAIISGELEALEWVLGKTGQTTTN